MKLTIYLICFTGLMSSTAATYAQLSLSIKNVPIKEVLTQIEEQTDLAFMYEASDVDIDRIVDMKVENKPVDYVLEKLFRSSNVNYTIVNKHIVLYTSKGETEKIEPEQVVVQQKNTVTGNVTDESGVTLPGVSIQVEGTTIGSVTDVNGKFTLELPGESAILVFTFIGYTDQKIAVKGGTTVNVVMIMEAQNLDEVVVIGYGSVKKRDLTGSIASVKSADLKSAATPSVGQMLQGKAAGLQVIQTSAQPGGGIEFNIRGYGSINAGNDPLIVIDGYPVSNENNEPNAASSFQDNGSKATGLNSINPADIESVEVLKDASATSIYGSRAGHGVILITTKKGKEGRLVVNYSNSFSKQKAYGVPQVLNGQEFMIETNKVLYENWMVANNVNPYGPNGPSDITSPFTARFTQQEIAAMGQGTNWYKEISQDGFIQEHNLSITGGSQKVKYLVSGNMFDQDGIIKSHEFKRYTGRINLDFNFNKYIRGGIRTTGSSITNNNVPLGNGFDEAAGIILTSLQFNPSLPIRDENGKYSLDLYATSLDNPVALLELKNITKNKRFLTSAFVEVEPVKDLVAKFSAGLDESEGRGVSYAPTSTKYGARLSGRAGQSYSENFNYQFDFTLNYKWVIAEKHSFSIMGGGAYQKFKYAGFQAASSNFITDNITWHNLALGSVARPTVNSWGSSTETASAFGRFTYNYDSKYLVTATFRNDGSADFAENHKWALFPSVAFAWRAIEEKFMKNQNVFSDLKFRISYGKTGNQGIGSGAYAYYGIQPNGYVFNNSIYTGVALEQLANPNLKWETTTETNFGIDLGLMKNRILLTGEYFTRVTSDLLSTKTLPLYQEIPYVAANIGATQSSGIELTLNTRNIQKKDFTWSSSVSFSYYNDRWKERDPSWVPKIYQGPNDPLRIMYSYVSDGLVQPGEVIPYMPFAKPGQIKVKDLDGYKLDSNGNLIYDDFGRAIKSGVPDGNLDDADVVAKFVNNPYLLGFNNSLAYKGFDLTVYIYAMFHRMGTNPWDDILLASSNRLQSDWNMSVKVKDRWSYDNQDGVYNSAVPASYNGGDFYYENTSFIRVKNINLGYTLPKDLLKVQNFRFFIELQNPFVFTKYTGSDPETDFQNSSPYPNQHSYSVGLNVTF